MHKGPSPRRYWCPVNLISLDICVCLAGKVTRTFCEHGLVYLYLVEGRVFVSLWNVCGEGIAINRLHC